jgi:hypothetical protein
MECEYCKNTFQNKYVLQNHQRRAKYCIRIQEQCLGIKPESVLYTCKYCNKQMATDNRFNHHKMCKQKKIADTESLQEKLEKSNSKIAEKDKEILELKCQLEIYKELAERELDCVEEIAKQPRTTNTQTNNNLNLLTPMDLNRESFSKTIKEAFGDNYLLEGQKGIARFAFDKLLKDEKGNLKYVCTDPSRQTYRFKALDGTIERDIKAKKLTSAIAEDVIRHSYSLSKEKIQNGDSEVFLLYSNNIMDINEISTDNGNFRNELASLTSA